MIWRMPLDGGPLASRIDVCGFLYTATEAIETALDLVLFHRELVSGTRARLGVRIMPPDETRR